MINMQQEFILSLVCIVCSRSVDYFSHSIINALRISRVWCDIKLIFIILYIYIYIYVI